MPKKPQKSRIPANKFGIVALFLTKNFVKNNDAEDAVTGCKIRPKMPNFIPLVLQRV